MCLRTAIRREPERGRVSGGAAVAGARRGPGAVSAACRSIAGRRRRQRIRRHRDHRRQPSHTGVRVDTAEAGYLAKRHRNESTRDATIVA